MTQEVALGVDTQGEDLFHNVPRERCRERDTSDTVCRDELLGDWIPQKKTLSKM